MEDPAHIDRGNNNSATFDMHTNAMEDEFGPHPSVRGREEDPTPIRRQPHINPGNRNENNSNDETIASTANVRTDRNGRTSPTVRTAANALTRNMLPANDNVHVVDARAMSHMYVLFSIFVALLAIISPPGRIEHHHIQMVQTNASSPSEPKYAVLHGDLHSSMRKLLDEDHNFHEKISAAMSEQFNSVEQVAKAAATANLFKFKDSEGTTGSNGVSNKGVNSAVVTEDGETNLFGFFGFLREPQREQGKAGRQGNAKMGNEGGLPPWLGWMEAFNPKSNAKAKKRSGFSKEKDKPSSMGARLMHRFIDPSLLEWASLSSSSGVTRSRSRVATEVVDKILTSTPRIVTIINLLLAVTYLLHSIVATLFLGEASMRANDQAENEFNAGDGTMLGMGGVGASASDRMHRSGRERLGGYLLFKLLLITAVVEPDTLDLLILLSWYTLLAFLRSLAYLAGITTAHTAASGQPPHRGVLKLLVMVLLCDISAATTCAALFHGAGLGMVALLLCDCALLVLDILTHLARFTQQILDGSHQEKIGVLERRQVEMHEELRNDRAASMDEDDDSTFQEEDKNSEAEVRLLSRQIDHEIEITEAAHSYRLAILDNIAFVLELFGLVVTMGHFLHVWALHGVTFNLVDGVLALHLHSAVSAFGKKIAERKNHNRIARDLDKCFEDATDIELTKASAAGDVCCICLGTMTMGHVKKVGCGHFYHTQCLREVVERARSIEAARCPLCRASVLDGRQIPLNDNTNGTPQGIFFGTMANIAPILPTANIRNDEGVNAGNQQDDNRPPSPTATETAPAPAPGNPGTERALFRLSTEGLLPNWLPIPAFSFEVVRRFPNGTEGPDNEQRQEQEQETPPSFWRRFLILAGAIPMSPEEESIALNHLSDMFPQYDRSALLRELRDRGSAEGVVESILGGNFIGVTRNSLRQEANDDENSVESLH